MGGLNRGRITVQLGGAWRLYQSNPLPGWQMIGVIERGAEVGALGVPPAGVYAIVNAGAVRQVDQRKVVAAIAVGVTGPAELPAVIRPVR